MVNFLLFILLSSCVNIITGYNYTWSEIPYPNGVKFMATFHSTTVGNKIFFPFGVPLNQQNSPAYSNAVYVYDVDAKSWSNLTMPVAISTGFPNKAFLNMNELALFAGTTAQTNLQINIYNTTSGNWSQVIVPGRAATSAGILPNSTAVFR